MPGQAISAQIRPSLTSGARAFPLKSVISATDQPTKTSTARKSAAFMTRKPANRVAQGDIISGPLANAIATPTSDRAGFRAEMTFSSHACQTTPDLGYCLIWSVGGRRRRRERVSTCQTCVGGTPGGFLRRAYLYALARGRRRQPTRPGVTPSCATAARIPVAC